MKLFRDLKYSSLSNIYKNGKGKMILRNHFSDCAYACTVPSLLAVLTHSIPPDATCNASALAGTEVNDDSTSKNGAGAVILQQAVKASADDSKKGEK